MNRIKINLGKHKFFRAIEIRLCKNTIREEIFFEISLWKWFLTLTLDYRRYKNES